MQGLVHTVEDLLVCKKKLKTPDQIEQNKCSCKSWIQNGRRTLGDYGAVNHPTILHWNSTNVELELEAFSRQICI